MNDDGVREEGDLFQICANFDYVDVKQKIEEILRGNDTHNHISPLLGDFNMLSTEVKDYIFTQ